MKNAFLRNKFVIVIFLLTVFFVFVQCSGKEKQSSDNAEEESASCTTKPVNPNGDSELSVLMRDMRSSSESLRQKIVQGVLPEKFPEEFLKIHTAKPTDSETKKASFEGFANSYIYNLQILYHSPKEELTQNYNAVVTACANCHSEHCPGPLKAINKLKI